MTRTGLLVLLAIGALSLAAMCQHQQNTSDAGDIAASVCSHLADAGCPQPANCHAAMMLQGHASDFKPACLLDAGTVSAIEACGTVICKGTP